MSMTSIVIGSVTDLPADVGDVCAVHLQRATPEIVALLDALPRLVTVDLAGLPSVGDAELWRIARLPAIRALSLAGVQRLSRDAMSALCESKTIEVLDLSHAGDLDGSTLLLLEGLRSLRILKLDAQALVDNHVLQALSRLPALERLSLWSCELVTDEGVRSLASAPALRALDLPEFADIGDAGIIALAEELSTLRHLRIANLGEVSDAAMWSLVQASRVESVQVSYCSAISTGGFVALFGLPTLERVRISGVSEHVRDTLVGWISRLRSSLDAVIDGVVGGA
jgi:hypothetical protein